MGKKGFLIGLRAKLITGNQKYYTAKEIKDMALNEGVIPVTSIFTADRKNYIVPIHRFVPTRNNKTKRGRVKIK